MIFGPSVKDDYFEPQSLPLLLVSPLLSGKRAGKDNLGGIWWCAAFSCPPLWEGHNGRVCNVLLSSSLLGAHSSSAWEKHMGGKISIMSFQSSLSQTAPGKKLSTSFFGLQLSAITLAVLLSSWGGDKFGCQSGSGVQRDFFWHYPVELPTEKHGGASSPSIHATPPHPSPASEMQALWVLFSNLFYLAMTIYFCPPG